MLARLALNCKPAEQLGLQACCTIVLSCLECCFSPRTCLSLIVMFALTVDFFVQLLTQCSSYPVICYLSQQPPQYCHLWLLFQCGPDPWLQRALKSLHL